MTIGQLLERDFSKPIEEIIKVNNLDEHTVYAELTEYVATDRIKDHYRRLLKAMVDAKSTPTEGIGVWISGFFGSGKSSFAKNLGYVLANRTVLGKPASELFSRQLGDDRIREYVDWLNRNLPCEIFMFDVQVDLAVQTSAEQIAEVMYRVLLRELDYAEDYDIAELEIKLEAEGKLDALREACQRRFQQDWARVRKGAARFTRTSSLLHEIDPKSFPAENSFLDEVKARPVTRLTVREIVERCFDLCARRRPGKTFVFIVDEMGQYVARSGEKLENLRAVVEQFGKVSVERIRKRQLVAPAWVVVTAQEKLEEVYDYVGAGRVELPKLQDRFRHGIHLSPADIREVATRRVLRKTRQGQEILRDLFRKNEGALLANCRLERTHRSTDFSEDEFVEAYPYLPHFIDLSIDIMNGLRAQHGAPRHLGGANRTIIRQADQMIAGDRTRMGQAPLGALVTLDKIYELVEGNLPSEKQKDILDIDQRFRNDPQYPGMAARVAKAVCLLEFVKDLPRTSRNLAAFLIDRVGDAPPVDAVEAVLQRLKEAQFVRETEEGWKLQTQQEKSWAAEKRGYSGGLKRGDRNDLLREALKSIFESGKLKTHNYNNLRSFSLGLSIEGHPIFPGGQVPVDLVPVEEGEDFPRRRDELEIKSRQKPNENTVFWLFELPPKVETLLGDLYASRQMIHKYMNLKSQNKITGEEITSLQNEQTEALQLEKNLTAELTKALEVGVGFFRGIQKPAGDLGRDLAEIFSALCKWTIPDLYPKVEMGCRPLKGNEAEEFLKQANLAALPQVFYAGDQGLNLVIRENNRFVPNPDAEVAQEILGYLRREHQYGNKVTGKQIADHFSGLGYGWQLEVVQLVLAVLFRAGSIVVTHQGRSYRNYQEPSARPPLVSPQAFRAASFAPRESIDLKTLTAAVKALEAMVGQEVDVEEGAIAEAFKRLARSEKDSVLPALATAEAYRLPAAEILREWSEQLEAVLDGGSEDCVRMLAGEGKSFRELRDKAARIRSLMTEANLEAVRQARVAVEQLAPTLRAAGRGEAVEVAEQELDGLLRSPELLERIDQVKHNAAAIDQAYQEFYRALHQRRAELYARAVDGIKGRSEFLQLDPAAQEAVLQPLARRVVEECDLPPFATAARNTGATLRELQADIEILPALEASAIARMQEILAKASAGNARVERVKLAAFFTGPRDPDKTDKEHIDAALERLREHLYGLLDEGVQILWE
jgi:hypothetical protein